jgi:uncharacterized protein
MDIATLLRRGRRLRSLGVDDGPFEIGRQREVLVVGAVYSAAQFEGLLSTHVRQDGLNATNRLIRMIAGSKFIPQLHIVLLDGITLGGFNIVDLPLLSTSIGLPCIAVMRHQPDPAAIQQALSHLTRSEHRRRTMARAALIHRADSLCFQAAGIDPEIARRVIRSSIVQGNMPECLRAAHLIARGVIKGESGRRA